MSCETCGGNWTPRGGSTPSRLSEYFELACSPIYADSGINYHLPKIRQYAINADHIVELGIGGGDQGTVALLNGQPHTLDSYDVNEPGSLTLIRSLAESKGINFTFHQGRTQDAVPVESDLLFIDTLHTADTVRVELDKFAPLCSKWIIAHDVVTFGSNGQCEESNQGINLAYAEFLYRNPEWRVVYFSDKDNGLLVLEKCQ